MHHQLTHILAMQRSTELRRAVAQQAQASEWRPARKPRRTRRLGRTVHSHGLPEPRTNPTAQVSGCEAP